MILIIGGAQQGKRTYVYETTGLSASCATGDLEQMKREDHIRILYGLETVIRELLQAQKDPMTEIDLLLKQKPNIIIICNEIGCGVVPMEQEDRIWRECVGRICCVLAKHATHVERIFCGIPMRLKGTGTWK